MPIQTDARKRFFVYACGAIALLGAAATVCSAFVPAAALGTACIGLEVTKFAGGAVLGTLLSKYDNRVTASTDRQPLQNNDLVEGLGNTLDLFLEHRTLGRRTGQQPGGEWQKFDDEDLRRVAAMRPLAKSVWADLAAADLPALRAARERNLPLLVALEQFRRDFASEHTDEALAAADSIREEGWAFVFREMHLQALAEELDERGRSLCAELARDFADWFAHDFREVLKADFAKGEGRQFAAYVLSAIEQQLHYDRVMIGMLRGIERQGTENGEAVAQALEELRTQHRHVQGNFRVVCAELKKIESKIESSTLQVIERIALSEAGLRSEIRSGFAQVEAQIKEWFDKTASPTLELVDEVHKVSGQPGEPVRLERLRYRNQLTPFVPRPSELRRLMDFVDFGADEPMFRWWAIGGRGGMGKSRIAFELCLRMREEGWNAGFLVRGSSWLSDARTLNIWSPDRPTLIVLDYAIDWISGDRLGAFIQAMTDRRSLKHPVRLLLLDRAGKGDPFFYAQLSVGSAHKHAKDSVYLENADAVRTREPNFLILGALPVKDWFPTMDRTLEAIGSSTRVPRGTEFQDKIKRITANGSPLHLQLAAVALDRMGTENFQAASVEDLLDEILAMEIEQRWKLHVPDPQAHQAVRRAAGYVTLTYGHPADEVSLESLRKLSDHPDSGRFETDLEGVVPKMVDRFESIQPDVLGGRYLIVGGNPKQTLRLFKIEEWLEQAFRTDAAGLSQMLCLMTMDFPNADLPARCYRNILQRMTGS